MLRRLGFLISLVALVPLTQCGTPSPPRCRSLPRESRITTATLVEEARATWRVLEDPSQSSQWPGARDRYNRAVAKLFDQLRCPQRPWDQAAAALGTRILPAGPDDLQLAEVQTMFPASLVETHRLGPRQTTPGLGLPLVGWHAQASEGHKREPLTPPTGQPFTITALLRFDRGGTPVWQFAAPLQHDETRLGGRAVKLAADWSAAHAFYWQMTDLDDFDVLKVLLPDRFSEETGLYFGQTYDPDRIPVVFIHGINSSPAAFKHMINALAGQEWFRKRYQVWFFNYPTGNPWILSATKFRSEMNAAAEFARKHGDRGHLRKTVIVAHSMGGLITRTCVSDPGNAFYNGFFRKPIEQLNVSTNGRDMIRNGLLYKPLDFPDRVIFLAVPHQGSPLAERFVFTWLSRLVRLPKTFTVELLDVTMRNVGSMLSPDPSRLPTAIDNLSPNDPSIRALQHTRFRPNLRLHSIIGDRGKNNTPKSSDGIVPYWSSHLLPVESEAIVPCGHGVPDCPQASDEVSRILLLHTKAN